MKGKRKSQARLRGRFCKKVLRSPRRKANRATEWGKKSESRRDQLLRISKILVQDFVNGTRLNVKMLLWVAVRIYEIT
jgi:hypothetical protein